MTIALSKDHINIITEALVEQLLNLDARTDKQKVAMIKDHMLPFFLDISGYNHPNTLEG